MTSPYRENQYKNNDPFDVLDHNSLKQEAAQHVEILKDKARLLIKEYVDKYPHKINDCILKIKNDLIRTKTALCMPLKVIEYRYEVYVHAEQMIIEDIIVAWFIEKLELKGFNAVKTNNREIEIKVSFAENEIC